MVLTLQLLRLELTYGDGSNLTGLSGGGNVSNSGTPSSGQVAVWTDSETIQGTSNFIIDSNSRLSLSNNDNNTSNTVFGKSAFNAGSNNSSDFNTVFGELVMGTGTVNGADNNSGFGYKAIQGITSANNNTAVGFRAGTALTTGAHNTFVGAEAGDDMVEGSYNIAIGSDALGGSKDSTADSSQFNIFMGVNSGNGAWVTAVSQYNIGIGHYTMDAAMNGAANNVAVGHLALSAITTGDANVSLGSEAGESIDAGSYNVSIGYQSNEAITSGQYNITIGAFALETATTALKNIMIGGGAGQNITAGVAVNGAIGIGYGALAGTGTQTTDINHTIAIGTNTLANLESGIGNTAVGFEALKAEDDGDHNTAIGYQALVAQTGTSGTVANTAVGYKALDGILTGTANVAVGANALGGADGAENENVGIGLNAGLNLNNGSNNIAIGSNTTFSTAAASNQVVIGKDAVGVANNSVTLGNADTTAVYMAQDSGATVHASVIVVGDGTADAPSVQLGSANDGFFHHTAGVKVLVNNLNEALFANGGDFHSDGDVIAFSTTISDKRLKDNVVTIESPIDKIKKLRGVEYVWNIGKRKGQKDLGVIAQEVEKVIPEIVKEKLMPFIDDTDTKYKTVDYEKLTAVLIEGMKDQQDQIDDLRKQIKEMKNGSS